MADLKSLKKKEFKFLNLMKKGKSWSKFDREKNSKVAKKLENIVLTIFGVQMSLVIFWSASNWDCWTHLSCVVMEMRVKNAYLNPGKIRESEIF